MYIDNEIKKSIYNAIAITIKTEDNVHIYGKNVNNKKKEKNKREANKRKHE